uniref:non-specific serine/threonine protein kinase n=1 Tax=Mastacembelus armatus TaxID=205130 RepID=A0A3Q3LKF1_9TELE
LETCTTEPCSRPCSTTGISAHKLFAEITSAKMAEVYVKYNFSKTQLGNGGFGCVYSGVRVCDGKEVAVKVIEKNKVLRFGLLQGDRVPIEVVMLKKIALPSFGGVIRMLDYYKWKDYWFIVMERPKVSQDLFDCISEKMFLDENTTRNFMAQVLEAIRHCRSCNIIHMDIKEENLLLDLETGELKLIDFGSAEYIQDKACAAFCGTKECMPPEMITGKGLCRAERAEVWSLGVPLYAKVDFKDGLSDACKDLISQCLRKKPEERATLDQILDHPWIAKVGLRNVSCCQPSEFEGIWSSRFRELTIREDEVGVGRGSECRRSGCSVIKEEPRPSEILIPQEPKTLCSNSVCCFSLLLSFQRTARGA